MVFQCAHGDHHHGERGRESGLAAFDVEEFLGAEIGAKSRLRDNVICQFEAELCRQHRIAAMRDVCKRPAMHEHGIVLERLNQIGFDRVFQDRSHRSLRLEIARAHRRARPRRPHDDVRKPPLQILDGC